MENEKNFEVRDLRRKDKFVMDDFYLNGYAKICGIYATGVYVSLCRHANKEQEAWPSIKKIAEELGISQTQTRRAIKALAIQNIVVVKRLGKKLNNRYYLLDKSEWSDRTFTDSPDRTLTTSPQDTHPLPGRTLHSKETQYKETHSKDTPLPPRGERELETQSVSGKEVNDFIDLFKNINPSYEQLFKRKNQREAVARLLEKHGAEKIA